MNSRSAPGPARSASRRRCWAARRGSRILGSEPTAHAISAVDAYLYGSRDRRPLPFDGLRATSVAQQYPGRDAGRRSTPTSAELTTEHVLKPGYDYGAEFEFGLDLVLDGLASHLA